MNSGTILVTGFEPFGGDAVNPSFEAVRRLPEKIDEYNIVKQELPVCFGLGAQVLLQMIEEVHPDAVICTGLAAGRAGITPEVCAIDLMHARIPDNAGKKPDWVKIDPAGPDGIFSALPAGKMTQVLQDAGIPASLSLSAGTFVCNDVMYRLLSYQRGHCPDMMAGFIHVPCAIEYKKKDDNRYAMPLADMIRGLELCVRTVIGEMTFTDRTEENDIV